MCCCTMWFLSALLCLCAYKCVLCEIRCARLYVFLVRVVVVLVIACAVIFVLNTCLCVVCQSV